MSTCDLLRRWRARLGMPAWAGLLCLAWCPAALACGAYRVSLYETGSLYFKNASGQYEGIDKDVVAELARRTGCKLQTFLDSRVRTWTSLASGELDMTVSAIATPEREAFAQFEPYITNNRNYLLVKTELAARVKSLDDFAVDKALRLGVVRSFRHGQTLDPWIDKLRGAGRVSEAADLEELTHLLAVRRVQGIFTQPVVWGPLLERHKLEGQVRKLDVAPKDSAVLGLALSRKRVAAEDAELMRAELRKMRADGTLEAIYRKYLDKATARLFSAAPGAP